MRYFHKNTLNCNIWLSNNLILKASGIHHLSRFWLSCLDHKVILLQETWIIQVSNILVLKKMSCAINVINIYVFIKKITKKNLSFKKECFLFVCLFVCLVFFWFFFKDSSICIGYVFQAVVAFFDWKCISLYCNFAMFCIPIKNTNNCSPGLMH